MEKRRNWRTVIIYLAIPIVIIMLLATMFSDNSKNTYTYSDVIGFFKDEKVDSFELNLGDGKMKIKLNEQKDESITESSNSTNIIKYTAPNSVILYEEIKPYISDYNSKHPDSVMKYDLIRPENNSWLLDLLPTLVLFLVMGFFWYFMIGKMSAASFGDRQMGFGKAKIKNVADERQKTRFKDVAGADEEKAELEEIVEFLKDPKRYSQLGARIPKGVLLVGPPGTGKTLLAKAVAGEAEVPFFSISGSDFVEMFVGVGASRVRDLFSQAKKNSPCIIFIDEIDAVGRQRGAGLGGGHDEREQTLNQLLVEMDGFGANEGVIMIAATNRPDILDRALMRPGRFDRQIVVSLPDIKGREAVLKVHAKGKPLAPDVDLKTIAKTTVGFTGADLENLLNEAALLSARKNLKAITMPILKEAAIKVIVGTEKKSRSMSEKDKKLTAYHEAGHAITTYFCPTQDKVHQISIIPRGLAGGFTMALPKEDKTYMSKSSMEESLVVLLGGRVAEALIFGDISTGASNDIERATQTANSMVTKYGMSDKLGPVKYGSNSDQVFLGRDMGHIKNYSEKVAFTIDEEIRNIITAAYAKAEKILSEHKDKLHEVAKYLIENEKMEGNAFESMMKGELKGEIKAEIEASKVDKIDEKDKSDKADETAKISEMNKTDEDKTINDSTNSK